MENVLEVKDLVTNIKINGAQHSVVDHVSFSVGTGEIVGVVGESGCGKSMTAMSLMQLLHDPISIGGGQVLLEGKDLLSCTAKDMEKVRGNQMSMIFQDVMTSLNPLMKIGHQIMEPLMIHKGMSKKEAKAEAIRLLTSVGIPSPERRFGEYPNSLSGGMRQRVMIAIAIACKPKLLIADEPTTALDVTVQAQILDILRRLKQESNTSTILITHDLGVVYETCDRALVMYCGQVVESGTIQQIFENPLHPYTKGLIHAVPSAMAKVDQLYNIPGTVPPVGEYSQACRFAARCETCHGLCTKDAPGMVEMEAGHFVRCHCYTEEEKHG